ncbi:MAG TPA: protein kinase [Bryobacteraceae bacterium]|jgi:two-component system LytT family response regulator|nr:protein kinase [Bryobacteraceae bacterium]
METLAHYRILSLLGAGGMGEVFLAEDTRLHRKVALKVLLPEVAQDKEKLARFVQEARAASALSHPNAAHIYEIGEADGRHFLAMEYIEGATLETRLSGEPLPMAEIISIASQVADALDAAHARGIAHRDIKPANLMIDPRGHVKVLDFGLAKILPVAGTEIPASSQLATQFLTSGGVVLGTVSYMSPEQALGRDIDHRTDLFSLGVVLYRMASGKLPFTGASAQETLARILQSPPDALGRLNYELPEEFERIVRKCLEKDRDRRYQSAKELLIDLRGLERAGSGEKTRSGVMRAVIVDDEELARYLLREYLVQAGVEVIAECANGFEAVKAISERKPDLVFLDVQMPKLDGFEVLELIDPSVAVIYVTAYDQYAMRAFDAHAVDYLLKPFSPDRFKKALERARQRLGEPAPVKPRVSATELSAAARAPEQKLERIVVKDGAKVHIIPLDKLDYVEAQDDYVALRSEKKNYLKQQTISSVETQLDPKKFVRIHRSYIVNLERIARIEPYTKDSRVAVLTDGTQLPVSRSGHARLKELLGEVG